MLPTGPGPSARWADATSRFADLESAGCSAIWLTDHLFFAEDTPDPLTMAAVAAAATTTCMVGTAVLQLPLRQVAAVAKAAATVAAVADGRFALGIGIGEHREEYRRAGAAFEGRGAAFDEGIAQLRRLSVPGDEWFAQRPPPQAMPLWIGGRSDKTIDRVAWAGDGWFPMFISSQRFARRSRALDQQLAERGREPSATTRAVLVIASVDRPGWSRSAALSWVGGLFRAPESALQHHLVTGSAAQVADALAAYVDVGADHVAVLVAEPDPRPSLDHLIPVTRCLGS